MSLEGVERVSGNAERAIFESNARQLPLVHRPDHNEGGDTKALGGLSREQHLAVGHGTPPFVEAEPTVNHPDDGRQFVLKAKAYRSLALGQPGVF